MFPSLLCNYDTFGSADAAVTNLARAHVCLISEGGRLDTKSEPGFSAVASFLESLESAAAAMRLDPADRSYRKDFTINYRALFPDEYRNYRVDILEASVEQNAVIWVNGDKFEFSAEAMRCAMALQRCWAGLGVLLGRWNRSLEQPLTSSKPSRTELRSTLVTLDTAWAAFEKKYIKELIHIEDQARKLIVNAVDCDRTLREMEASHKASEVQLHPDYRETQRKLVKSLSRLNSVANFRRKGRDDLTVEVLWDAQKTIARCEAEKMKGESTDQLSAALILSGDVLLSFESARNYLQEIGKCLERVDPHLCNNAGLVSKLVDWEESWEIGTRYVQNEELLRGLCDLVAETRLAQKIVPGLREMCEECDVELFMVMPRIIWLRGLEKPSAQHVVFKGLLPHRFLECQDGNAWNCDEELTAFVELFRSVEALLTSSWPSANTVSGRPAWEILLKRAVNSGGTRGEQDLYSELPPGVRPQVETAVEDFIHRMEGWSMEIQRHCAEDWNQFLAILSMCLSGGKNAELASTPFQV
eukprot:TRINITY_DN31705_c0_g1_i1.p1 TRINITY_DN31705_c0_g1~~TRINITY_DN31705_c0_g1_i1.p1  ORF type:complete len:552 (+),score=102.67 TRINITY_DN31705_c0_g1_i1:71-1657(+)